MNYKNMRLQVHGNSMWPQLLTNDRVIIEVPYKHEPRRGEIVLIKQPNDFVLHRIINIVDFNGKKTCLTRGDNSRYPDQPINSAEIIGHLVAIERGERTINVGSGFYRLLGWCIGSILYFELILRRLVRVCLSRLRQFFISQISEKHS